VLCVDVDRLFCQHTFPWDYKAAEFGDEHFSVTTSFINLFAKIGWAYDLKTVTNEVLEKRMLRTGDGSKVSAQ
jgi:stearoyl-CoA desaturase (Delta-9 desaturase)